MSGSGKQLLGVWMSNRKWGTTKNEKDLKAQPFHHCSLYHYRSTFGTLKSVLIFAVQVDIAEELAKVLLLLKDKQKTITHLEMRADKQQHTEIYIEVESKFLKEWNMLQNLVESLNAIDIHTRNVHEDFMGHSLENIVNDKVWFPRTIQEIDNFQHVLMYGTELDADHPGFTDAKYRKRRRMFAEIALFYKHGDEIPRIKYTVEEKETWRKVYNQLEHLYEKYACKEFKENWKELQQFCNYGPDEIPQLEDVNNYLKNKTGFQVRPVAGYLSPRDFLSGLAFRVFHCTQYIRHSSEPFYTPEPDCCHELLGHMPMLADKKFAQFSQEIGLASLGANDEDLRKLAACYFFTIEFGLCVEDDKLKIFGAGLLSSASEIEHVMDGVKKGQVCVQRFDVVEAVSTPCVVTSFQKRYFYTNTIQDAQEQLRSLAASISKPFKIRYNPYTQGIEEIEDSDKVMDIANELRGDLFLIQEAIKESEEKESLIDAFYGTLNTPLK